MSTPRQVATLKHRAWQAAIVVSFVGTLPGRFMFWVDVHVTTQPGGRMVVGIVVVVVPVVVVTDEAPGEVDDPHTREIWYWFTVVLGKTLLGFEMSVICVCM
jgi:hypothetical protein